MAECHVLLRRGARTQQVPFELLNPQQRLHIEQERRGEATGSARHLGIPGGVQARAELQPNWRRKNLQLVRRKNAAICPTRLPRRMYGPEFLCTNELHQWGNQTIELGAPALPRSRRSPVGSKGSFLLPRGTERRNKSVPLHCIPLRLIFRAIQCLQDCACHIANRQVVRGGFLRPCQNVSEALEGRGLALTQVLTGLPQLRGSTKILRRCLRQ